MSQERDAALNYARAGFYVLALRGIVAADDDPFDLYCSCPQGPNCTQKHGKHPHSGISSSGSHSATNDPDVVADWPDEIINVGIATGFDGLFVVDFDDAEINTRLAELDAEGEFRDIIMARTGRGYHDYARSRTPSKSCNIYDKATGVRLGEIRSTGQYVVAPPSRHVAGNRYAWTGPSIVEGYLELVDDAWEYAAKRAASVGVTLVPPAEHKEVPAFEGSLEADGALDALPFQVSTLITNHMKSSVINRDETGREDKSATLFWLACQVYREADAANVKLAPEQVAAIVKAKDLAWGSSAKFARRGNATECYWTLVHHALDENDRAQAQVNAQAMNPTAPGSLAFAYDETIGFHRIRANGAMGPVISNFDTKIVERIVPWDGVDQPVPEEWIMRCRQGTETASFRLGVEERTDPTRFVKAIAAAVPSDWVVGTLEERKKFLMSVQQYSGKVPVRRAYMAPGWLPERDAFLLPAIGAIAADEGDPVTYENPSAPSRVAQYGVGMRPGVPGELESYLRLLFTMADPSIVVPVFLQMFAAPLASLGMNTAVAALHLQGRSGSLKTSIARVAMATFGAFGRPEDPIDSWTSSPKGMQNLMYYPRDLPLLIDDYKHDSVRRDLVAIIQNYADRVGRTVATREGGVRESPVARCLLLSTGENWLTDHESLLARTVLVDADVDLVDTGTLAQAQKAAKTRDLAVVGYEWIAWLAAKGQKRVEIVFGVQLDKFLAASRQADDDTHKRLLMAQAGLRATGALVDEFIKERAPGFVDDYRNVARRGWVQADRRMVQQAEEAASLSPWEALRREIIEGLARDELQFPGRLQGDTGIGSNVGEKVGYVDADHVYLPYSAFGWYKKVLRSRGDTPTITWEAFRHDAVRHHGAVVPPNKLSVYGQSDQRLFKIPRLEFFGPTSPAAVLKI